MKEILITIRDMFHYVKGKHRYLVHAEIFSEGIEYTIEKDVQNDTVIVLIYVISTKKAQIKFMKGDDYYLQFDPILLKTITKRDFNMCFMSFLLGITNIQPFENEDKTAN